MRWSIPAYRRVNTALGRMILVDPDTAQDEVYALLVEILDHELGESLGLDYGPASMTEDSHARLLRLLDAIAEHAIVLRARLGAAYEPSASSALGQPGTPFVAGADG